MSSMWTGSWINNGFRLWQKCPSIAPFDRYTAGESGTPNYEAALGRMGFGKNRPAPKAGQVRANSAQSPPGDTAGAEINVAEQQR